MGLDHPRDLAIAVGKEGASVYDRAGAPMRLGLYTEVITPQYAFYFNMNGEIRFIRGLGRHWPHPLEALKRTDGNDWVYYSVGSPDLHVRSWLGEYYHPCPAYSTNAVVAYEPFSDVRVMRALAAWSQLHGTLHELDREGLSPEAARFVDLIRRHDENELFARAERLYGIIGQRPSVLPPDTRHVDYEVIPLTVADGCRYHCRFCCVKSAGAHRARTMADIRGQIDALRRHYGPSLPNYGGLFLANHDALGAGGELLLAAAEQGLGLLEAAQPTLHLFGSADSLLEAGEALWRGLSGLGAKTHLNIGLESAHQATLDSLGKPLSVAKVREAFAKMLAINSEHANIEVTANFLLGEDLGRAHYDAMVELLAGAPEPARRKGAVYLSPLLRSRDRAALLETFFDIKRQSVPPVFIYLIQRL